MGDIGHRNNDKAASVGRQCRLDALLNGEEGQRIGVVDAVGVTHGDADLADAAQTLLDHALVTGMKQQSAGSIRIDQDDLSAILKAQSKKSPCAQGRVACQNSQMIKSALAYIA
jgi:hypothetical protein